MYATVNLVVDDCGPFRRAPVELQQKKEYLRNRKMSIRACVVCEIISQLV